MINPQRILIVDDNDSGRYATSRTLRQAGYETLEAATGQDALRCVARDRPDLVLLDVRLPDMSGLAVCSKIKADPHTATIPVLHMSASLLDAKSKLAGLESGADGYVTQPVEPAILVGTVRAFLRMRRAEQALKQAAMEWQTTLDTIADGVALLDSEGLVLRFNRALPGLLDRDPATVPGASWDDLLPPGERGIPMRELLSEGRRESLTCEQGDRVFHLTVHPTSYEVGEERRGVCVLADITERRIIEQRMQHTQKLESIGLLAGGIAHDFNNLLTGILGNASLALDAFEEPDVTRRSLESILRAGERAADLTRQLLAYSGRGRFVIRSVDLSRTVEEILPLIQSSFPRKVQLDLRLKDDLPAIEADHTQIEQLVMNLVINAAEAIGEKSGTVTITTAVRRFADGDRNGYFSEQELDGNYVTLTVLDNGVGMDEETRQRIFDPFFTTKFLGRGLGLSAAMGIVRGHKGAIRVSSTPGEGTEFEVAFPASEHTAKSRRLEEHEMPRGQGTVLVVDDEEVIRELVASTLERQGYRVFLAKDGEEAIECFRENHRRISLVLLDLVMPVMSGEEALRAIYAIQPDARVVVSSGQSEDEVLNKLRGLPVAGFVQKPYGAKLLAKRIADLAAPQRRTAGG